MTNHRHCSRRPSPALVFVCVFAGNLAPLSPTAHAQIVISGNETKIELTSGAPVVIEPTQPDSLTLLDFAKFPPKVRHLTNISNSVIGPPSNIAIAPDGSIALIADSIRLDATSTNKFSPARSIHILDLRGPDPRIVGQVEAGLQPSGISFTPDGRHALVANRADGTVSVLSVNGPDVKRIADVKVCEPAEAVADVAIGPDGILVLASVQKGGYLAALKFENGVLTPSGRKISTYGQPYRCVIAPTGDVALTAGQGFGNGLDRDALTVIDIRSEPYKAIDYVAVGAVPESLEISPDGLLVAVVLMNGSNLPESHPHHTKSGGLAILERNGRSFKLVQDLPIGPIPEGVAFTPDGRYLVVQCHADQNLRLFAVQSRRVKETGRRIPVPGMPSSLRAGITFARPAPVPAPPNPTPGTNP